VPDREQLEKLAESLARQERDAAAIAARCREEGNEQGALFNVGMVAGYSVSRFSLLTLLERRHMEVVK
jgi:hypothetical protein